MAKIGLKGFYIADYSEGVSGIEFKNGKKAAKAVTFEAQGQVAEATLYADNAQDDKVRALTALNLTLTPNDVDTDMDELTGVEEEAFNINGSEQEGLKSTGVNDEGKFKAVGIIVTTRKSGTSKYRAEIYSKCKFVQNTDRTYNTQGESISFDTTSVSGSAYPDKNNKYLYWKDFTTETEAEKFLTDLFTASEAA